jgi:hypothetical protein
MAALRVNIVSFLYLDVFCVDGTLHRWQQRCLRWSNIPVICVSIRNPT